jgi:hypothetical protein
MGLFADEFWNTAKGIENSDDFMALAFRLYEYQSSHVPAYKSFVDRSNLKRRVLELSDIPFMPVELFKTHKVHDGSYEPSLVFSSSGTTGSIQAKHYVVDERIYKDSFTATFKMFYGDPSQYCIMALLPGYLEREGSSLVYMMQELIDQNPHPFSGFYLNQYQLLSDRLLELQGQGVKTFLLGVSFALLDFFELFPIQIPGTIIMETGGMKGRRKELVREELHEKIQEVSGVSDVHSEYGMTELFSQAYSKSQGRFLTPPWMRILVRELHSPFGSFVDGITGQICIIDLANVHSCAFLSTQDLGKKHPDGSVEVLGRMDESDLRGCNLMV